MTRFLCIHGHFYQPPRENPWIEAIERQNSAAPFHDWNARVNAECYAVNSAARILDAEGRITQIVNNYERISFNFGPTLLHWLKESDPKTYESVLRADRRSSERFSGHGNALAQAYHHCILPLANSRDKYTEIYWGIRDFENHFKRSPEGMWLPETAVDLETLEILSDLGIRFTILAPIQARMWRAEGEKQWIDIENGEPVDPRRPYTINLSENKTLTLFFYDGSLARAVAFEQLLHRGEDLTRRLMESFEDHLDPQLVHLATDGETYGHHHAHGEMALAWALKAVDEMDDVQLTNYGEYLDGHQPDHEIKINERTSWSCAHGVDRWKSDCGCQTGGEVGWNQAWRKPLRESLNWLRDQLATYYEEAMQKEFPGVDPWGLRNQYIELAARPRLASEQVREFLKNKGAEEDSLDHNRILQLLEMQRHALMMFTSCGWFFNDISGIETQQILLYAARAIELFGKAQSKNVENEFTARLESAVSNLPQHKTGATIYTNARDISRIELSDVAAHFAMYSLFEKPPERQTLYVFRIHSKRHEAHQASAVRLVLGSVRVQSLRTLQGDEFILAICHFGGHSFTCGVRSSDDGEWPDAFEDLLVFLERAELGELVRGMDRIFGKRLYSLRSLFGDEKERFLERLLNSAVAAVEEDYRGIYHRQAPLMRFLAEQSVDQPRTFLMAAEFTINAELVKALRKDTPQLDRISELLEEATSLNIPLENQKLSYEATRAIEGLTQFFAEDPMEIDKLEQLIVTLHRFNEMPIEFDVWTVQNLYFQVAERLSEDGDLEGSAVSEEWSDRFRELGRLLHIADPRFVSLPSRDFRAV